MDMLSIVGLEISALKANISASEPPRFATLATVKSADIHHRPRVLRLFLATVALLSRAHLYRHPFLPSGWRAMLRIWVLPPRPRISTIDLFESLPSFPQANVGLSSSPRWKKQLPDPAIA